MSAFYYNLRKRKFDKRVAVWTPYTPHPEAESGIVEASSWQIVAVCDNWHKAQEWIANALDS